MPLYPYLCRRCCWTETLDIEVKDRDKKQWCDSCREHTLDRTSWRIKPEGWYTNEHGVVTIRKEQMFGICKKICRWLCPEKPLVLKNEVKTKKKKKYKRKANPYGGKWNGRL